MYQLGTVPLSCDLGEIEVDSASLTLTEKNIAGLSESFTDAIRIVLTCINFDNLSGYRKTVGVRNQPVA